MKRGFIALALLAASCNEPAQVCALFVGTCPAEAVKSVPADESINALDLYVFRAADGQLEARVSGDGNSPLEATVSRGREMRWYMIANAPEGRLPSCTREDAFLASTVLLEDGFVMHGSGNVTFQENGTTVNAVLKRYICKVGIGSLTVDWADALPCSVETIALMNVQGSAPLSGTPADLPLRYNCGSIDDDLGDPLGQMLSASPGVTVESASPVNLGITLWCMPNPSEGNSYGLPWTSRRTRVAVCLKVWGLENWYPIDLPAMKGNRYYLVDDIVIRGPGAAAPDMLPERIPATFTVKVLGWGIEENNVGFSEQ